MYKLPDKLLILLVSVLVLSTFVATHYSSKSLYWDIKQEGSQVNVYLKGFSASKVVGADLNIFFDKNNLKVTLVSPGGFFNNPIVIRSDNRNLSYSIMINPESRISSDLQEPLFKFLLSPNKLSGYKFCILPSSQVYLSKVGGSYPETLCQNLK
jgi:hypothetical protein